MKYAKWTVFFFSLALVSWLIFLFVNPSNFELVFLVFCSALTIAFVDFFFVWRIVGAHIRMISHKA